MSISVGARHGVIDDLFVGSFLGRDSDIVFDYRHKATRSFHHLHGDYYIAPLFLVTSFPSLLSFSSFFSYTDTHIDTYILIPHFFSFSG